jgi:methionine-S-sulfoxide reductase
MEKSIYFAGGCFWGVEAYFQQLKGVERTRVGYAQGNGIVPTYAQVCTGTTGYTETTEIYYDDTVITLVDLLGHFFRFVDPTSLNKQGNDIGTQYRSGIYYVAMTDVPIIEKFLQQRQRDYDKPFVIEVEQLRNFFAAEPEHQDYLLKHPGGYCHVNLNVIKESEKKTT